MARSGRDDESETAEGGASVFSRFARRIQSGTGLSGDARELVGALLETSDRAKTEAMRLVAREVRSYLQELGVRELLTGHSLEVQLSLRLKPLVEAATGSVPTSPPPGSGTTTPGTDRSEAAASSTTPPGT